MNLSLLNTYIYMYVCISIEGGECNVAKIVEQNKQETKGKALKRVPRLKDEMQLRNTIAYTHALNVLKVEKNQVCHLCHLCRCLNFRIRKSPKGLFLSKSWFSNDTVRIRNLVFNGIIDMVY